MVERLPVKQEGGGSIPLPFATKREKHVRSCPTCGTEIIFYVVGKSPGAWKNIVKCKCGKRVRVFNDCP